MNGIIKLACAIEALALLVPISTQGSPAGGKSARSVAELLEDLGKTARGSKERRAALIALEESAGPQADNERAELIGKLDDEDIRVQEAVVKVFLRAKDAKAASKLREKVREIPAISPAAMTSEEEARCKVRSFSALALSGMKDESTMPIIIDRLGDAPFPAAYDEQLLSLSAIGYGKDILPAIKNKIERIGQKNPYGKMRLLIVVMNIQDKGAVPELRRLFESEDPDIKSAAAKGLRNIGENVDVQGLFRTLNDLESKPQRGKKWATSRSLVIDEIGFSGNPEATPLLKTRIEAARKLGTRNRSCYPEFLALARIGGQENYAFLENIFRTALDESERGSVVDAFSRAKMREAVPLLLEALDDKSASKQFRVSVAYNLGEITGEKRKYSQVGWDIMEGRR